MMAVSTHLVFPPRLKGFALAGPPVAPLALAARPLKSPGLDINGQALQETSFA